MTTTPRHLARTTRDDDLLQVLTHRVRVLSLQQIAETWWPRTSAPFTAARRRLEALVQAGLLEDASALVHPQLPLPAPLFAWTPRAQGPDFGALSYQLQSRWTEDPLWTRCVVASRAAGQYYGGWGRRPPRELEHRHDIHVAAVYLRLRRGDPQLAQCWVSEAQIYNERDAEGGKLPDALLRTPTFTKAIEFGGAYPPERLREFHEYCRNLDLPYEVW